MTILESPTPRLEEPAPSNPLPLENGDRLTRAEFERRYDAMPEVKKAELIEGKVYMSSPVRHDRHARPHTWVDTWLGLYEFYTPGTEAGNNGSLRMDLDNMPQPDVYLMLLPEAGGQARVGEDGYVEGAPELVVEVAASSASYDLHEKLNAYRRNGVREYVVWQIHERAILWYAMREGRYELLAPEPDGILRSEVFPGLWLDAAAMVAMKGPRVVEVLQAGLASPEHAEFVGRGSA